MPYFRVNDKCNGCLACVENCPAAALAFRDRDGRRTLLHNMAKCARCGQCWRVCPQNAIEFQHFLIGEWDQVVTLDLIHCRECGEPLYSTRYEQDLAAKLNTAGDDLCPRHQQRLAAARYVSAGARKTGSKWEAK